MLQPQVSGAAVPGPPHAQPVVARYCFASAVHKTEVGQSSQPVPRVAHAVTADALFAKDTVLGM